MLLPHDSNRSSMPWLFSVTSQHHFHPARLPRLHQRYLFMIEPWPSVTSFFGSLRIVQGDTRTSFLTPSLQLSD